MAIDVAVTSSRGRDRYLRRLKSIPVVTYPDLATAKARFRLMPKEGGIAEEVLHEIAEKSLARTEEGGWTLKFDRESFLGGDGTRGARHDHGNRDSHDAGARRAQPYHDGGGRRSRRAQSNENARLVTIPNAHHHVILEKPEAVARVIEEFVASL